MPDDFTAEPIGSPPQLSAKNDGAGGKRQLTRRRLVIALLAILVVSLAAWVLRPTNAYEDRFGRIELGMHEEAVHELMGGPPGSYPPDPDYVILSSFMSQGAACDHTSVWMADNAGIVVRFDKDGSVLRKHLFTVGRTGFFQSLPAKMKGHVCAQRWFAQRAEEPEEP